MGTRPTRRPNGAGPQAQTWVRRVTAHSEAARSADVTTALVIDPDDTLRAALRQLATERALDLCTASPDADPLQAFERHLPDLVIATIGRAADTPATHALRRLHAAMPCRLVIAAEGASSARSARAWADRVLTTPVDAERLGAAIDDVTKDAGPPSARGPATPDGGGRSGHTTGSAHTPFPAAAPLRTGPFVIDGSSRTATCDERPLTLTRTEFDLLLLFVQHDEQVLTREQIVEHVWGDWVGSHHHVDVHLSRLRRKIALTTGRAALPAVRGVGYRLL